MFDVRKLWRSEEHGARPYIGMNAILNSHVAGLLTEATPDPVIASTLPYEYHRDSGPDPFDTIEAIHRHAETMTPLLKEILEFRPSPDWGLND